jgi:hypothetical protein
MYWSNRSGGEIRRANLDGTGQTILVTGENLPDGPALDIAHGHIYWGRASDGSVHRTEPNGTGSTVVLAGIAAPPACRCLRQSPCSQFWPQFCCSIGDIAYTHPFLGMKSAAEKHLRGAIDKSPLSYRPHR